jgi:hypothetical protein
VLFDVAGLVAVVPRLRALAEKLQAEVDHLGRLVSGERGPAKPG